MVALDVQFSLLLYLAEANAARRWVWLDRSDMPERWQDLRRAVYSRAGSDALPGAEPPAARP